MIGSGSYEDRERVLAVQRKRWEFLRYLYDENQKMPAGRIQSADAFAVAGAIGIADRAEADRVFTHLKDAGLVKFMSMGPTVKITLAGTETIERALAAPDVPTEHFAAVNVITVTGGIHGSPIQQGTQGSSQATTANAIDWPGLRALLPQLRQAAAALPASDAAIVSEDIAVVEKQSQAANPRIGTVRESLASIRSALEGAGGSLVAEGLIAWLRMHGWL